MLLIQGFFFQEQTGLALGFHPSEPDGPHVLVRTLIMQHMFAGALWKDKHDVLGSLVGTMNDKVGISELSDVMLSDKTLSFSKTYEKYRQHPNPSITYIFEKDETTNTWVGIWVFRADPNIKGTARCIVREIDDELIQSDVNALGLMRRKAS